MKITLLTHDSIITKALIASFKQEGLALSKVIVYKPKKIKKLLKEQVKKLIINLLSPILFRIKQSKNVRLALKKEKELKQIYDQHINQTFQGLIDQHDFSKINYLYTENINSTEVIEVLKNEKPDVLLVFGTPILKRPVIECAKLGTINSHSSILPEYRGTRSEFWQCYDQAYDHVGVTFHLVDTGIDTGKILMQVKNDLNDEPNPFALRASNLGIIVKHFPKVIKKFISNELIPKNQIQGNTRTFKGKDITFNKRVELYSRLLNQR